MGVGLLYRSGYFRQQIDRDGRQIAQYPENDFATLPLELVKDEGGAPLEVLLQLPGRRLHAQIWMVRVGRVKLYLLDTDTPSNTADDRKITARLYEADRDCRLRQEILLGMGGVQLMRALGIRPSVYHMNEGHSAFLILERIRLLMQERGLSFAEAGELVRGSSLFTTHTPVDAGNERFGLERMEPYFLPYAQSIGLPWPEFVRMGRFEGSERNVFEMTVLALNYSFRANGVSALHSDILRNDVFKYQCAMEPEKFRNVTNGIDHRRWLAQINPRLDELVRALAGGDEYLLHPEALKKLEAYAHDTAVLDRLGEIKRANKLDFAAYVKKTQGVVLNTDAIFDVQVKRLHEYKRQLLNAMHILYLYQQLQNDPNRAMQPRVFLFGAKAAPGYAVAKRIIRLINSMAAEINADPVCRDKLQVVFLENYRVSLAEHLMPASEVSQQISTAGKEASGTGNMKFMMNGALTVGTLDGANVEMHEVLGDENMFLFGLHADEVVRLKREGYTPQKLYTRDESLRCVIDKLKQGFSDGSTYEDLASRLLLSDEYMLLQDFASYCAAEQRMAEVYSAREEWNRKSLYNIARSGIFAADRAVKQYADTIWRVAHK